MLLVIVGVAVGLTAALGVYYAKGEAPFVKIVGDRNPAETPMLGASATSEELTAYAFKVLEYIKNNDFRSLAAVVHPEYGVLFSPYATIAPSVNQNFTVSRVEGLAEDTNTYVWGKYDGNDNPIELTPSDYFKTFVFDEDYTQADKIGVDAIIQSGNALENITEVFPSTRFVDFHVAGTDADAEGLDWSSLRLGFEEYDGQLMLTVILHSEWTV